VMFINMKVGRVKQGHVTELLLQTAILLMFLPRGFDMVARGLIYASLDIRWMA